MSLDSIKETAGYIPATVHYNKRARDKKFEIVGVLPPALLEEMKLNIGGEVVLAIADDRQEALNLVRFFRGHQQKGNNR